MADGTITACITEVSEHAVVGTLEINNPDRRNAMSAAMYEAVPAAVDDLTSDPRLRAVIVRGAGTNAFSAGSDISEFSTRRMGAKTAGYDNAEHLAWAALARIEVPVIAAIHGPCRGGGVAIALHCDLRITSDRATFSTPPARIGIAYPIDPANRLVDIVGPATAKRMLFTAAVLDAAEAHRVGLADEVVSAADLDDHVWSMARHLAHLAPLSLRAAKAVVDGRDDLDDKRGRAAIRACYVSDDFKEGVQAFMEKRDPKFTGG